jgi:hypothetical protein
MEAVHIFGRRDGEQNSLAVDLGRQRHLDQDAVDFRTAVQFADDSQQVLGGNRIGRGQSLAVDAQFLGSLDLIADVKRRVKPTSNG